MMSMPQLKIPIHVLSVATDTKILVTVLRVVSLHPFSPGAEVPGAPDSDRETTQKSSVNPH